MRVLSPMLAVILAAPCAGCAPRSRTPIGAAADRAETHPSVTELFRGRAAGEALAEEPDLEYALEPSARMLWPTSATFDSGGRQLAISTLDGSVTVVDLEQGERSHASAHPDLAGYGFGAAFLEDDVLFMGGGECCTVALLDLGASDLEYLSQPDAASSGYQRWRSAAGPLDPDLFSVPRFDPAPCLDFVHRDRPSVGADGVPVGEIAVHTEVLGTWAPPPGFVGGAISDDGTAVISVIRDGVDDAWLPARSMVRIHPLTLHPFAGEDGALEVRVLSVPELDEQAVLELPAYTGTQRLHPSPDARRLVLERLRHDDDGRYLGQVVELWDLETGERLGRYPRYDLLAFLVSGDVLLQHEEVGTLIRVDGRTGDRLDRWRDGGIPSPTLTYLTTYAQAGDDGTTVEVRRADTGEPALVATTHHAPQIRFSSGDELAVVWGFRYLTSATGGYHVYGVHGDAELTVFDVSTGEPIASLPVGEHPVRWASFSPSGDWLAAVDIAGEVVAWRVE